MGIVTSVSLNNSDWEYVKRNGLSPSRLIKIGIMRHKHFPEDDMGVVLKNDTNYKEENEKLRTIVDMLKESLSEKNGLIAKYEGVLK